MIAGSNVTHITWGNKTSQFLFMHVLGLESDRYPSRFIFGFLFLFLFKLRKRTLRACTLLLRQVLKINFRLLGKN